jgi:hypothetical protein
LGYSSAGSAQEEGEKRRFTVFLHYLNDRISTKIRIPASRFKDASAFVTDMDSSAHGLFLLSLHDQVKARQLSEERDGWVDLTDVNRFTYPIDYSPSQTSGFYLLV